MLSLSIITCMLYAEGSTSLAIAVKEEVKYHISSISIAVDRAATCAGFLPGFCREDIKIEP